jgi:hypothetical protein
MSRSQPARPPGALLAALLGAVVLAAADSPPGGDEWKYDIVYRTKGEPYRGLVRDHKGGWLRITCIVRRPGRPTIVYPVALADAEIDRVDLLPDDEREALRRRLDALREEHKVLDERLKGVPPGGKAGPRGADRLDLPEVAWVGPGGGKALAYTSSYFRLVSNAGPEVVEPAVLRLERIYAAYVRCLPPRARGALTTILLPRSLDDYRALVRGSGHNLLNPAFYDADKNQIVCECDWQRMAEDLESARRHHAKLLADLDAREADLRKAYKGDIPAELKKSLAAARTKVKETEERNREVFARRHDRLFRRLYHEAFHAYLANFVYPPTDGELPRWLNEGLAQIFETAIVEVGELRVGHVDQERFQAVRRALAKNSLLPLADLLRSGPRQFVVAHDGDQQISDRYYLTSWALAHYLTFDRKLLGTRALDDYVHDLKRGGDPLAAFVRLTGRPLAPFEKGFRDYLGHLRPDGTVGAAR